MTQPPLSTRPGALPRAMKLEYPMSVATFDSYADAQKAVDHLADQDFAVENLAIVGTDLRQYERVLGRKSWGSVLLGGAVSGLSSGLLIALMLVLLQLTVSFSSALLLGIGLGVVFGMVTAALAHALSRGERDFTSITQTFATSYEVMCEHKVAAQARELLARMPGVAVSWHRGQESVAPGATAAPASGQPWAPTPAAPSTDTFDPRPPSTPDRTA